MSRGNLSELKQCKCCTANRVEGNTTPLEVPSQLYHKTLEQTTPTGICGGGLLAQIVSVQHKEAGVLSSWSMILIPLMLP